MYSQIDENTALLDRLLRIGKSFDVTRRDINVCGKRCSFYFVDGMIKDDTMQRIMDVFMKLDSFAPRTLEGLKQFCDTYVAYVEVRECRNEEDVVTSVLSGAACMIADGLSGAVIIDARTYPVRAISEPDNDRVLRGARVGFTETLVFNTALLRRHIRDPRLTIALYTVGDISKTDLVLCYMEERADAQYVKRLKKLIDGIRTDSLTLGIQSVAECIAPKRWLDPFPKIRYTERPDCAAAHILEGKVVVICDNCPSCMILPTSIFDFLQETDDFYLPPLTGTYLRVIRCFVFFMTLMLAPTWYLLLMHPEYVPPGLEFILVTEETPIPIIIQLFILEFAVDGLKLAALNTPTMLSGSFSIIGGLILGEFAVEVGWFLPDTILYMAFVAVANFAQPSYELGYAFKFMRLIMLALTGLFGIFGYALGVIFTVVFIAANKTVAGGAYLYPLIPFNAKALYRAFVRTRLDSGRKNKERR